MSDPTSIEAMIAELGPPRNYAEQVLLDRMRAYAAAEAVATLEATRYREWVKALVTKHAIEAYRAHGATPVLEVKP